MLVNNMMLFLEDILSSESVGMKTFSNNNKYISNDYYFKYINSKDISGSPNNNGVYAGYYGLVFGTGTTPPQLTDYKLENRITTGYNDANGTISLTNNKFIIGQVVIATSDVTISEVGIRITNTYYDDTNSVLLARTVLSEPVVLQAGDSKTFTAEIDFNTFIDNVNNL